MNFRTRLDITNRQVKQFEKTDVVLSGSSVFGIPFSGLTVGPDPSVSGISETVINISSTFSGNTGTTVFTFGDSRMDLASSVFSAITTVNSATTQSSGYVWTGNTSQTLDDNSSYLDYSGVSFEFQVTAMTETAPGIFTGSCSSTDVYILSAGTLDFTDRTIWVDVPEILRTNKLIVTNGAVAGQVLTAGNSDGDIIYTPVSAITSGDTYVTASTFSDNTLLLTRSDGVELSATTNSHFWVSGDTSSTTIKSINGSNYAGTDNSIVGGGKDNTISASTGAYNAIIGGYENTLSGSGGYLFMAAIVGGQYHSMIGKIRHSFIGGGDTNTIDGSVNSGIIGGKDNLLDGSYGFIGGGSGNTLANDYGSIIGGRNQLITSNSHDSVIVGGSGNTISGHGSGSILGQNNTITGESINSVALATTDGLINNAVDSLIIGGSFGSLGTGTTNNVILGGTGNTVNDDVFNSIILGSSMITADTSNTVFADGARLAENGGVVSSGGTPFHQIFATTGDTGALVTGFTYNNNELIISQSDDTLLSSVINTMTGLTVDGGIAGETLTVNGGSVFSGETDVVHIYGSGTTNPILTVEGSAGELFSVTDSLSGTLVSFNTASGFPVLEVNDDDTVLIGSYLSPALNVTTKVTITGGTETLYTLPDNSYTSCFFDYTVSSNTGGRAGNVMAMWSGDTVVYTDATTSDIGSTSAVTMSVTSTTGGTGTLSVSATTGTTWVVKTIIRSI